MSTVNIKLKDGSIREVEKGISILDFAKQISEGLARVAVGAELNGAKADLMDIIDEDCELNILRFDDDNGKGFFASYKCTYFGTGGQKALSRYKIGHRAVYREWFLL